MFERRKGADMAEQCLFCRIAKKEMKSDIVREDEEIVAFREAARG